MTTEIEPYTFDVQDPHNPVWDTDAVMSMQATDDPSTPENEAPLALRNAGGVLEFIEDVIEETVSFLEVDNPIPDKKMKLDSIRTRELGADKWRGGQRNIAAGQATKILEQSDKRRAVTLVNFGPNIAYLSSVAPGAGTNVPQPNQVSLLVSGAAFWAPMVLETKDDIWAMCAAAQTARIEVWEEFDLES